MNDIVKLKEYLLSTDSVSKLDMSYANLNGLELFREEESSGELVNANFENVNFVGADISGISFIGVNFKGVNFTGSKFYFCKFDFTSLDSANLSNTEFDACTFTNATLVNCNLTEISLISSSFIDTNLEGVILKGFNLGFFEIIGCNLQRVNLEGAELYNADLSNSDLSYANLRNASLIYTNLSNTILHCADLTGIKICESDIEIAEIIGDENLRKADIIPYSLPIHRSLNFVFESNDCREYITTNSFCKDVNTYHSDYLTTIKMETIVHRDNFRYCLSIETMNEHILSLKNKINITERPIFIHNDSENEIELRSLEYDECGNLLPLYGLIIYFSDDKEVTKCVFRLLDDEKAIEYLTIKSIRETCSPYHS